MKEGIDYPSALKELERGYLVTREGMAGYLCKTPEAPVLLAKGVVAKEHQVYTVAARLDLYNRVTKRIVYGWTPSQEDLVALDWRVIYIPI